MTTKVFEIGSFFSLKINKITKFINDLNIYNLSLLISVLILIAHPAMTEHIEFALAANQQIHVSKFNYNFMVRMLDLSSQISFFQFLLNLNLNPNFTQILVSFVATLIPVFATLSIFKLIDFKGKYSNTALLALLCAVFYFLSNPINAAYYPWSPRIGFFEFGNQGMWLCIASLILLILNRRLGFFLSGILFSWHIVWFLPILLYLLINLHKIEKKNYLYLATGLMISFFFVKYGKSNLGSFISFSSSDWNQINFSHFEFHFKKITDSIWSQHNPKIFANKINYYYLLAVSIPILSLNYLNLPKQLIKFCNLLFLTTFFLIFYLEFARHYPLPFSDIIFRAIPNRFFNLIMAIYLYYLFFYCLNFNKNIKINNYFLLFVFVAPIFLYLKFYNILRLALFILSYKYLKRNIKYLDLFLITIFLVLIAIKHYKSTDYNIFSFLHPNKLEKFLSENGRGQGYILSQGIQSYKGLNVTAVAMSEYFSPTPPLFINNKSIDLFCYETSYFDNAKFQYYWDVDKCFMSRSKKEWDYISNQIGVNYVIVSNKVSLDLILVLDYGGLRIYRIVDDNLLNTLS
jgi:hypothetical protein